MQVEKLVQKFRRESRIAMFAACGWFVLAVFAAGFTIYFNETSARPADPLPLIVTILFGSLSTAYMRLTEYLADLAEAVTATESPDVSATPVKPQARTA